MPEKSRNGFSLVELLVTIVLIAILATISVNVYSNTQQSARDGQRRSEIDSISKALETKHDGATGQYTSLDDSDFAGGGIPQDPRNNQTSCQGNLCKYCVRSQEGNCGQNDETVDTDSPVDNATAFVICTNLEKGTPNFYCRTNQR